MEQFRLSDTEYYFEHSKSKHPAYLFRMSSRDLARFGLLYQRNGKWKDQQIVPADWINESIKPYSDTGKNFMSGYGYLWWIGKDGRYEARGFRGQTLMVHPGRQVVIVYRVNTDDAIKESVPRHHINKLLGLILEAGPVKPY
jgi:CubicO group peptidase (beta-lactamase class C family)